MSSPDTPSDRLPRVLYRLLLRLLPRSLRKDYEGEMERLFADRLERADGFLARAAVWTWGVGDVLSVAVAERLPPPWRSDSERSRDSSAW